VSGLVVRRRWGWLLVAVVVLLGNVSTPADGQPASYVSGIDDSLKDQVKLYQRWM